MDVLDDGLDAGAADLGPIGEARESTLYRVLVPRQNLVVRLNGSYPDTPEEEFLAAVRPYGMARMAWAIWREVPGATFGEAVSHALRARRDGETEVMISTKFLAEHVASSLAARHRLAVKVRRMR